MLARSVFLVLLLGAVLQGCVVGPQYTPLTSESKQSIEELELYNLVIQDEIKPAVRLSNASGALGGGLIGAVIDSSVNKRRSNSAQDIINPLYDEIVDIDYRTLSANKFNTMFLKKFKIKNLNDKAEAVWLNSSTVDEKVIALENNEALLYLSSFYDFTDDSKYLTSRTVVQLYKKDPGSSKGKNLIYYNAFNYQSSQVGNGGENSISDWSRNNAELYLNTLNDSLDKTVEAVSYDLQTDLAEECTRKVKAVLSPPPYIAFAKHIRGKLVKNVSDTYALVRTNDGAIYAVPKEILKFNEKSTLDAKCQEKGAVKS